MLGILIEFLHSINYRKIIYVMFVCRKVVFFWKVIFLESEFLKVNYFLIFCSVMENKLENTFQYLAMLWKIAY